eukprot:74415_1
MALEAVDIIATLIVHFEKKHMVPCICRADMQREPTSGLYGGNEVNCDSCGVQVDHTDVVWHCPAEYNIFHPDGYDICNNCYIRRTEAPDLIQISNTSIKPHVSAIPMVLHECKPHDKCASFQTFITHMRQYNDDYSQIIQNMNQKDLIKIVNDYMHVIQQHDADPQFQLILNQLGYCDITNCTKFRRNCRNRMIIKDIDYQIQSEYNVAITFMDRMHCHFQHCYDSDRFSHKCQSLNLYAQFTEKAYHKYNQLSIENESKHDNDIHNIRDDQMYEFGIDFEYGFELEPVTVTDKTKVKATYESFKVELMENPFAKMNIQQFNHEYDCATVLFNSAYCKRNKDFQSEKKDLTVEYLLSLMIYCNYTDLQYEFSKTYRVDNGDKHTYFYHWGKFIKICINFFGTKAYDSNGRKFFHGVSKHLYFKSYLSEIGLRINCPISTSTVFAVASRFAKTEGLLVELQLNALEGFNENYLSLAWLSNYAYEKEYLFAQGMPKVIISNIIEVKTGCEYVSVFQAIHVMQKLFDAGYDRISEMDESMQTLLKMMLGDRLSTRITGYQPFKALSVYGRQISNTFFLERKRIMVHYWMMRKYCSFLADFLVYLDFEWIQLDHLITLCPNADYLYVSNIKLSSRIFENILRFLSNIDNGMFREIIIENSNINNSEMSIIAALNRYSQRLQKFGVFVYSYCSDGRKGIVIKKYTKSNFIGRIITDSFLSDLTILSDDIVTMATQMVMNKISKLQADDDDQREFNRFCDKEDYVECRAFLRQCLAHEHIDGWIQMNKLNQLFPNLGFFAIDSIKLCPELIEDILKYLHCTNLDEIVISSFIETDWSKEQMMTQYKEPINLLNWKLVSYEENELRIFKQSI